jgi:2,3-bisphosphoglycerate-independent phosphoglycerate mutase
LSNFEKFEIKKMPHLKMISFTEYEKGLKNEVLFSPQIVENPLAKVVSEYNLKQLHIAETEKYAHVTFFLNGTREEKFVGEDRILVPSPLSQVMMKTGNVGAGSL